MSNCHFYALAAEFPGSTKNGHLAPTKVQIKHHRPILAKALQAIQPDIIVPVGKMAISEVLGQKNAPLDMLVGTSLKINPFNVLANDILCIPLSHPSGRSAWNHTHKVQVQKALDLLQRAAQ